MQYKLAEKLLLKKVTVSFSSVGQEIVDTDDSVEKLVEIHTKIA